jgi:hypothetical protein
LLEFRLGRYCPARNRTNYLRNANQMCYG